MQRIPSTIIKIPKGILYPVKSCKVPPLPYHLGWIIIIIPKRISVGPIKRKASLSHIYMPIQFWNTVIKSRNASAIFFVHHFLQFLHLQRANDSQQIYSPAAATLTLLLPVHALHRVCIWHVWVEQISASRWISARVA